VAKPTRAEGILPAEETLMGVSRQDEPLTAVKGSLPCASGNVCATVAINRLVKTTSMDSSRLYGEADTDGGPAREPRAAMAQFGGRVRIAEEHDRATERPDGPDATTPDELREPTHLPSHSREPPSRRFYPMGGPTLGRNQPTHSGRVLKLMVCG